MLKQSKNINIELVLKGDPKEKNRLVRLLRKQLLKKNVVKKLYGQKKWKKIRDEILLETLFDFLLKVYSGNYKETYNEADISRYCYRIFERKINAFLKEVYKARSEIEFDENSTDNLFFMQKKSSTITSILNDDDNRRIQSELAQYADDSIETLSANLFKETNSVKMSQDILDALSKLDKDCRKRLILFYLGKNTHESIAAEFNIKPDSAKTLHCRCMKYLRKMMRSKGYNIE